MQKTILITGATDGIGLETAKMLSELGHKLLLHGRNPEKLEKVVRLLSGSSDDGTIKSYVADLSDLEEVADLADIVSKEHKQLDVLINNAGVFKLQQPVTKDGLDARFVVNTIAPFYLTMRALSSLKSNGRVINLSSAAQSPVSLDALAGRTKLNDMEAYAQSKLAITMWTRRMAVSNPKGPVFVAVNPGSLLGSKMVKEGFGVEGSDLRIGADILTRAALSEEFANASGQYFDNDQKRFASPHPDALDELKIEAVFNAIENLLDCRSLR